MGVFCGFAIRRQAGTKQRQPANGVMDEELLTPMQVKYDLDRIRRDLAATLAKQIAAHTVSLEMGRDGLVISLREAGFFDSGSATPKPEALPTLRQIAERLGATPYDLRIEGHTDNVPIHNAEFDSNWELSSARATHIARLFLELKAIPRRPAFGRGVRRISSCGQQRHCRRPRGEPARGPGGAAANEDRLCRDPMPRLPLGRGGR